MFPTESDLLDWAIQILRPGAEFTYNDADFSSLNWISKDVEPPTKAEVEAQIVKLKAQFENEKAEREAKRKALLDRLGITEEEAKLLLS